ncbi:hypothetical protein EI639_01440 [Salmonella enterica]|nr:hypothetical protein [Salmonella enterica]
MKNTHNASGHHIVKRDRCRKGKPAINKFFDIHESSRFNMSFKCSGEFNIIYIMRTNLVEAQC